MFVEDSFDVRSDFDDGGSEVLVALDDEKILLSHEGDECSALVREQVWAASAFREEWLDGGSEAA